MEDFKIRDAVNIFSELLVGSNVTVIGSFGVFDGKLLLVLLALASSVLIELSQLTRCMCTLYLMLGECWAADKFSQAKSALKTLEHFGNV